MRFFCCEIKIGTGKTMSVICSALQWVLDRRRQQEEAASAGVVSGKDQASGADDDEPDWMRDFVVNKEERIKNNKEMFGSKSDNYKNNKKKNKEGIRKDFRVVGIGESLTEKGCEDLQKKTGDAVKDIDEEFLLEEYESEDEKALGSVKRKASKSTFASSSEDESDADEDGEEEEEEKKLKVYFCSRTHSQLSQFIKELRKTVFANEMRVVSLGSRKNLCINQGLEFASLGRFFL